MSTDYAAITPATTPPSPARTLAVSTCLALPAASFTVAGAQGTSPLFTLRALASAASLGLTARLIPKAKTLAVGALITLPAAALAELLPGDTWPVIAIFPAAQIMRLVSGEPGLTLLAGLAQFPLYALWYGQIPHRTRAMIMLGSTHVTLASVLAMMQMRQEFLAQA